MTDKTFDKFRQKLLTEIEKLEKMAKSDKFDVKDTRQKLVDEIKQEIDKNLTKIKELQKAEDLGKSTYGLASGTPTTAEVKEQNDLPVKSVFELLKQQNQTMKSENLEKGMGVMHMMRAGTKGTANQTPQQVQQQFSQQNAAKNAATAMPSEQVRKKSIPSKLKMSHGDYGITKNADGSLSLIYNKKYKSPVLSFLFGNKPKEIGKFSHRAEAYQALLGHHDQVNAGLIKQDSEGESLKEIVDPPSPNYKQSRSKEAVLPHDKKPVEQEDPKTTGSGGQVKETNEVKKDEGTGVVAPQKPAMPDTVVSRPRAAGPKLPQITPQPAKPMNPNFMSGKQVSIMSNSPMRGNSNNSFADRANIASGIAQFSKEEPKMSVGPIDGAGAVTGDNKLDKASNFASDPSKKMMHNHSMVDAAKDAKRVAALPAQQKMKMPTQSEHQARAATFSDFMPKGNFNKQELMKEMENMDKMVKSSPYSEMTNYVPKLEVNHAHTKIKEHGHDHNDFIKDHAKSCKTCDKRKK